MKNFFTWQKIGAAELLRPSVATLLIANILPLLGVIFLKWEVFPLLVVFWLENVIVGVFNVLKMLLASPASGKQWGTKVVAIPFFCFHYGMFTAVHGMFVFLMFGGILVGEPEFPTPGNLARVFDIYQLWWAVLALFISHLVSFIFNYIGRGEYKQANVNTLMGQPYARVVILHVTIIIGAFLIGIFGSPVFALILLIALKAVIDIQAHLREHKKYAEKQAETVGTEG